MNPANDIDQGSVDYLDYEINQWYESIDDSMKFSPVQFFLDAGSVSRGQRRLQVVLYLRKNQLRINIYRPVLNSLANIMASRQAAQTIVDVSKDTIRVLSRLNEATDIYRTAQVLFDHFLTAALGVLFLAISHAPNDFSNQVRDEFYQALDIVRSLNRQSRVVQRFWTTIKGLKEIAPNAGLASHRTKLTDASDPHSAAALAMAGLSGHAVDEMSAYTSVAHHGFLNSNPYSGNQMTDELTNLFEAAGASGGMDNVNQPPMEGSNGFPQEEPRAGLAQANAYNGTSGNNVHLSKLIGGLF